MMGEESPGQEMIEESVLAIEFFKEKEENN